MNKLLKLVLQATSLFLLMFQISCNSGDDSNSDCNGVACTNELVTITVFIEDQDQNPVALDSFEVINIEDESEITIVLDASRFELARQLGAYPLVADGGIEMNQEVRLQFKGFINDQEVVNSNYTVADDCCHVGLVSGDLQLVL